MINVKSGETKYFVIMCKFMLTVTGSTKNKSLLGAVVEAVAIDKTALPMFPAKLLDMLAGNTRAR